MKLYVPRLFLAALACAALCNPGPALADNEPKPSNRNPGTIEPASNWLHVVAVRNDGVVGSKRPFFAMSYWCHKTDCDLREQGTGKNGIQYFGGGHRNGIPVYTLLPASNPLAGSSPYFRAIPAPWGVEVDDDGLVRFFELNNGVWDSKWVADLKIVPGDALAAGSVIVGPDEARENGKPLPLGFADEDQACTPQGYEQYYGSAWDADQGKADRLFLPIELEFEKAKLYAGGVAARVHSGQTGDYSWKTVVDNVKVGNLVPASGFVATMRPQIRAAAQAFSMSSNGPSDEFTPFEKRFLHCRMGFAGVVDDWMSKAAASSSNPAPFVASWRGFVRDEIKYYLDKQQAPPAPGAAAFAEFDPKPNWDEMVARTKQWLAEGKAAPAAQPSQPAVANTPRQQVKSKIDPDLAKKAAGWADELK